MKTIIYKNLPLFLALTSLFFILVESQFKNLTESVSAPWQMYFHDPETPIMEGIINFHDKAMCLIILIVFAVGYFLFRFLVLFENKKENRLSEKIIYVTVRRGILPLLVILNLGVPSFALLEGTKGNNTSHGSIVKLDTQDSTFLDTLPFSGFLPELKDSLISNSGVIVLSFIVLGFLSFKYFTKNSGPNGGPNDGSINCPNESSRDCLDSFFSNEVKNPNVIQSDLPLPAEMSVDIHNENYPICSFQDSVSTGEEFNSHNSMSNESSSVARIEHGIESVGGEEKYSIPFSEESLPTSVVSLDEFLPRETVWDQFLIIFNETSLENRNFLISKFLINPDSSIQVEMVSNLIDYYHSLTIPEIESLKGLHNALHFCNNFSRNHPVADDLAFIAKFDEMFNNTHFFIQVFPC